MERVLLLFRPPAHKPVIKRGKIYGRIGILKIGNQKYQIRFNEEGKILGLPDEIGGAIFIDRCNTRSP